MCGLTGFIDYTKTTSKQCLDDMIATLKHRGPNNSNSVLYETVNCNIGLAHARLSIIDLSEAANQPMQYKSLSIVFNGEIYNFNELKVELIAKGHKFNLESDTELILHAFEEWGIDCVKKFIGMFVIVIYDASTEKMYFFRDRAGVKPLYIYQKDKLFIFGSELKAIIKHPSVLKKINKEALSYYFKFGHVPSPLSIYEDISKFPSGHIGVYDLKSYDFIKYEYWNVYDLYNKEASINIDYESAKQKVEDLLISSILYRKIADVPIGVFLSGGYDSTTVAAILQKNSKEKIKTFTIGFNTGNNEAPYAKKIAAHIGSEHHEFYCDEKDALEVINELSFFYDEPFADSSAIPTTLVSKKAAELVKVVISADGGDEIFFGYDDYNNIEQYSHKLNSYSKYKSVNLLVVSILKVVVLFYPISSFKRRKLEGAIQTLSSNELIRDSIMFESYSSASDSMVKKIVKNKSKNKSIYKKNGKSFKDKMSLFIALDYNIYMQNDMLVKVDRATMSQSIEGREPFLDHRLVEYCASLPTEFKFHKGVKKRILKDILFKYIPEDLFVKNKQGFTVPIYDWLKGDLSFLIDENLNKESLEKSDLLDVNYILKLVEDFKNEKLPENNIIWKLLMFQMWYKKWMIE
jgi:asparagine synthase (glutamine-hydrolysing)